MVTDRRLGFVVKRRPHPVELECAPDWIVDLAYECSGGRRHPVEVNLKPYCFEIESTEVHKRISFVHYYDLVQGIADGLMAGWVSPEWDCCHEHCDCRPPNRNWRTGIHRWVRKRTGSCINKLIHPQWTRLLGTVDPDILEVQKKIFSASFGYGPVDLITRPEFYENHFVVKDVKSYRAAAVAAFLCDRWFPAEKAIETMVDWKRLFSPTGESYTSLNRTLMNLSGNISPRLLGRLGGFVLPRPITTRLELIAIILAHSTYNQRHLRVWSFANEGQIKEAMRRVGRFTHRDLSTRRWEDVQVVVRFVDDYPDCHNGNLVGLAQRAIRWHRDIAAGRIKANVSKHGEDKQVAKPPIPLPDLPGIRFLETVGDISAEGEQMRHCIATYIEKAINGYAYLFHVDYEGELASVEVDWFGNVIQASGPTNEKNRAVEWGRKALSKWGRNMKNMGLACQDRVRP